MIIFYLKHLITIELFFIFCREISQDLYIPCTTYIFHFLFFLPFFYSSFLDSFLIFLISKIFLQESVQEASSVKLISVLRREKRDLHGNKIEACKRCFDKHYHNHYNNFIVTINILLLV